MIPTRKYKGEEHDWYACRDCGKTWKSTEKKIGHSVLACKRYHKKVYGWV